ncbi:alpha/beta fold hydrolase [Rhodococcus sp. NPDC058521]|uniref:alpha/beta fold hydrolase n=1 Tax=Rhodococcus sp. NPDC058521 TaxID=3346536 RepID=UPI00365C8DDF
MLVRVLAAIVAIVVVLIVASTAYHHWQTPRDKQAIEQENGPVHRYVDVDGHRMSVAIQGTGPRTIVLMPGLGTPEPILDFAPLARRLAEKNTVVTIENFGLGLSDETDSSRTSENIVSEIRTALEELDRSGPYVLMPHSISGLYATWWATNRPDEVSAVVGIDDERFIAQDGESEPAWPKWMSTVTSVGGIRDLITLDKRTDYLGLVADYNDSLGESQEYTQEQQDLYLRGYAWVLNPTMLDEAAREPENLRAIKGAKFPATMPTLSILASSSLEVEPEWESAHHATVTNPDIQQVIVLDGHHYLFHDNAAEIAEQTQTFLDRHLPAA